MVSWVMLSAASSTTAAAASLLLSAGVCLAESGEDGKITGTALRVKDTYQYFDWIYMNESKKLPEISFVDP